MNHKGTVKLETERLILRKFEHTDAEDMFNNWVNDGEVTKYLTWLPHKKIELTQTILEEWINSYKKKEFYQWAIVPKNYNKVIGSITVVRVDKHIKMCDIGYCIGKEFWGNAYVSEALKKIIEFLINEVEFNRIQAIHDVENKASGRVMIKSGMNYEGRLREYFLDNRKNLVDVEMYSILKRDFKLNRA